MGSIEVKGKIPYKDEAGIMEKYRHCEIEEKWRNRWTETRLYQVDLEKAKRPFYNLMMFPYPSAEGLHVGNVFAFVGSDIQGRFHRLKGYDVFEPIGFDAFGIHSENFALKTGAHPKDIVPRSIENFRERQLKRIGNMYDWSHVVDTTSPDYYRWTQWIFVKMFKQGLAYRAEAPVNWCPSCRTVLAAEQVINGECERCSSVITKGKMEQWFFKITHFTQKLLDNLEWIDWPEKTKAAEQNWIGRSEGALVTFRLADSGEPFEIFTTRPDTLFGVTYVVFSPEHPLLKKIVSEDYKSEIDAYQAGALRMSEIDRLAKNREKTGVFTGAYAINPINDEKVPIWVSDYVIMEYGSGAIMAVPAHDSRDFEFAKKYHLDIRMVISPKGEIRSLEKPYTEEGLMVNSGQFNGLPAKAEGIRKVTEWLAKENLAKLWVNYRLRDWCISRQRYWGPPIPIIYCQRCGTVPVPEEDLPVLLPDLENYQPDGSGRSPLSQVENFYHTVCPECGGEARRETDVSDNFLCSAWYFYRYPSSNFCDRPFDDGLTRKWLPVDLYVGGNEHAVLHLLYSRFLCMAFHQMGLIDFEEPFKRFVAHGLIVRDGAKMSKNKGNVVNPDEYIQKYGADAFRVYLMFTGDYLEGGDFKDEGVRAMRSFLDRIYNHITSRDLSGYPPRDPKTLYWMHRTVKAVTGDIKRFSYNTALARLMEWLKYLITTGEQSRKVYETFLLLLAPFAPFLTEELWERLGNSQSIFNQTWPGWIDKYTQEETVEFVVQINGKVRARFNIEIDTSQDKVEELIKNDPRVKKWIMGKKIIKKVFVPDKLINIVLS